MSADLRLIFIGDSFVQGVGDPEHRGWVGRVLEATGPGTTGFNLGVRRETSNDVIARWRREVAVRITPGADNRLVVSFGSNDMVEEGGRLRVTPRRSIENLVTLLQESRAQGLGTLVVGPPPITDAGDAHLRRTAELAGEMSEVCRTRGVRFIETTRPLARDPVWSGEALAGDGAHPGRSGYRRMAGLILRSSWSAWISSCT